MTTLSIALAAPLAASPVLAASGGLIAGIIFGLIIGIAISIWLLMLSYKIGEKKTIGGGLALVIVLIGGIIGFIIVCCLPNKPVPLVYRGRPGQRMGPPMRPGTRRLPYGPNRGPMQPQLPYQPQQYPQQGYPQPDYPQQNYPPPAFQQGYAPPNAQPDAQPPQPYYPPQQSPTYQQQPAVRFPQPRQRRR